MIIGDDMIKPDNRTDCPKCKKEVKAKWIDETSGPHCPDCGFPVIVSHSSFNELDYNRQTIEAFDGQIKAYQKVCKHNKRGRARFGPNGPEYEHCEECGKVL